MSKPIPDKAEVAIEYPDKLYIGTFERTARFDAHLDEVGISLNLHRTGADNAHKSVHMHFHYALFAEILHDLAKTVVSFPASDIAHREAVREAAKALYLALEPTRRPRKHGRTNTGRGNAASAYPGCRSLSLRTLTPVHGWFTGELDTLDLKEAKTLFAELA
jgi:hypothetical protein